METQSQSRSATTWIRTGRARRLCAAVCTRWAFAFAPSLLSACWADDRFEDVEDFICSSGEIWTYTDKDSPLMNPGRSCVQCHAELNDPVHAPLYTVAGTVMLDEHEADDCRGAAWMSVILTDADGTAWTLTGNSAGNFWLDPDSTLAMPFVARIVDGSGNERVKQAPVENGDCAACHTREGANGARGRLVPPGAP